MCTDSGQIFTIEDYVNNNTPRWVKEYHMKKGKLIFYRRNRITAVEVSIWTILWNYMCWVFGGKPDGWEV